MELVNEIYWVVPINDVLEQLEDCQKERFLRFTQRHALVDLDNGELGIYKKDLEKFYWQFGYNFMDRLNEN